MTNVSKLARPATVHDPKRVTSSAAATGTAAASASDGAEATRVYTGFAGAQATSEGDDEGVAHYTVDPGQVYVFAIIVAGLLGGFVLIV
ncbi:MAG: hypothetical protein M1825_000674 [Sarcosagium campestre]|nr:MAG: hypothetical protein M1825_000674 [Sarcosagium campestre]